MAQSSELVSPAGKNVIADGMASFGSGTYPEVVIQNARSIPEDTSSVGSISQDHSPGKLNGSIPAKSWRLSFRSGTGTGFSISYKGAERKDDAGNYWPWLLIIVAVALILLAMVTR